jgi:hypothetical protein
MARIAKSLYHCSAHWENTTEQNDDFELHIALQVGMPCMTARRLGSHLQDYTSLPVIAEALSAFVTFADVILHTHNDLYRSLFESRLDSETY